MSPDLRNRCFGCLGLAMVALGCSGEDPAAEGPDSNGFRLTTGVFGVAPGEEVQDCYFFEVPSDDPMFIRRIHFDMKEGSHHMNLFRVKTIKGLSGEPGAVVRGGECWNSTNWSDWPLIANTQLTGSEDFSVPAGVATRFEPRERIMLQTHYVNVGDQKTPDGARVDVDFYGVPAAEVKHELGTLFATNQAIRVCPGQRGITYTKTCQLTTPEPITIVAANGHFHARGDRFTMNTFDPQAGAGQQFYENFSWNEPEFVRNLDVKVPKDGGVRWSCEFSAAANECGDPDADCCFTFGGKVNSQEHCNAFVYYYPQGSTSVNCF